jgi:hypothetical protein
MIFFLILILSSIEASEHKSHKFNDTRIDLIQIENDKNIIDAVLEELKFVEPKVVQEKKRIKTTIKRISSRKITTTTTVTTSTSTITTITTSSTTKETTSTSTTTITSTTKRRHRHHHTRKHKQTTTTTTQHVETAIQTEGFFDRLKKVFTNDD